MDRMDSLALGVQHKRPEPRDEASPTGFVHVEQGESRAVLLTPDEIDPDRLYPLVTVLHGAGRQDEIFAKMLRDEPEQRQALFLIPRSVRPTWDLIAGGGRPDLDFLEYAYDLIYRRYPVDAFRQSLLGYSDGASYGLSLGLSNPRIFSEIMGWAAGFCVLDADNVDSTDPRPRLFLEYGTHDQIFPFEQVALPMRDRLRKDGYDLLFRTDQGGRHMPSPDFTREALDWFFAGPGSPEP